MARNLRIADLFCGAGGTSTGLIRAAEASDVGVDLVAINHWEVAVETHAANHPGARHLHSALDAVDPKKVVDHAKLDVLIASPECTHHSTARGGRPMSDQSRASAWHVVHWASAVAPEVILVENVPEFATWGPIGRTGRPIESRRGDTFRAWVAALESLGYVVEWRVLNAADFGDPTTRRRLFIFARRGRRNPEWPLRSHRDPKREADLFDGELAPWRTAREAVIDWDLKGTSILGRTRPLAESTLRRIAEGLRRFGGENAAPFLALLRGTSNARSIDRPAPSLTAGGEHVALCEPFLLGQHSGSVARPTSNPTPTIATDGAISLVEPYLVPFWGERRGQRPRTHATTEPLPTVPAEAAKFGLVEPFVLQVNHGDKGARDAAHRVRSVDEPAPTVTAGRRGLAVVVPYNGESKAKNVDEPLPTATTRDRFGIADARSCDVLFRMLQPHELAAAMGFPKEYKFQGNRTETVRQIGNAVPVGIATALCKSAIKSVLGGRKAS